MKKLFLLICAVYLTPVSISAGTSLSETVYHITQDMNRFSTLFPLKEGSLHEEKAIQIIKNRLHLLKISYSQYAMNRSENIYSRSTILDAIFPGRNKDEIFLIIPLDSDNNSFRTTYSFNIATALMLAQTLQTMKRENTVHIVFMGAEFGKDAAYPLGTTEYLNSYYPEHNSAFFYCHITGIPEKIDVSTAGTGNISPLWILEKSISSLRKADFPYRFRQGQNLIYRLKLNDHPSIIDRYLDNGYPAILFKNGTQASLETAGEKQNIENYYKFLLDLTTDKAWNIPSDLDRDTHYLFLNHGKSALFVNEQTYVIFLIVLFSLILLYPFIERARFRRYVKTISKHLWTIPALFFITFFFLEAATLILKSILIIRSFKTLWENVPFFFLVLKLSFASFLFLLSVRLFKFLNFAHKGSFYSAASLLFIILDVFLLCTIDISFAFYLVPVLFTVFLFTIFRNRWFKLFFLLLSAGILVAGMINMFFGHSFRVIHIFLLSSLSGNLLISANLLPVLLMIYRLRFLFHSRKSDIIKKRILYFDFSLGFISLALYAYLILFNPFSQKNPQPLTIQENISLNRETRFITLKSPAPLGNFILTDNLKTTVYSTKKRKLTISSPFPASVPVIKLTKTGFLNRSKYMLSYDGTNAADRIEVKLISDKRIVLFDSNFSYRENNDATELTFNTGFFPKKEFFLSFTLPRNFNGELLITGIYTHPENRILIKQHYFTIKRVQYIKKKLLITNAD